jgi:hypothetical protein
VEWEGGVRAKRVRRVRRGMGAEEGRMRRARRARRARRVATGPPFVTSVNYLVAFSAAKQPLLPLPTTTT